MDMQVIKVKDDQGVEAEIRVALIDGVMTVYSHTHNLIAIKDAPEGEGAVLNSFSVVAGSKITVN